MSDSPPELTIAEVAQVSELPFTVPSGREQYLEARRRLTVSRESAAQAEVWISRFRARTISLSELASALTNISQGRGALSGLPMNEVMT